MDIADRLTTSSTDERGPAEWGDVWSASGAMGLSGRPDGPPLPVPVALPRTMAAAADMIGEHTALAIDGPALLGERAALLGLTRNGPVSCGGGTRLLQASDHWIAISLAREDDRASVPAWLELDAMSVDVEELWSIVTGEVRGRNALTLVEQAALLAMPVARLGEVTPVARIVERLPLQGGWAPRRMRDCTIVDLSSLWAGPLCASLLGLAGARVIKVESVTRPDGARRGEPSFFDLLHAGHESVALDFAVAGDIAALRALVDRADIVIEASRPRALAQLGLAAEHTTGPKVWLTITGHGGDGGDSSRVAFGDDAAVAGGLVTIDQSGPCFCADAVADPATGVVAAAAVVDALARHDRSRIGVALSRTAAWLSGGPRTTLAGEGPTAPPRHRPIVGTAPELGADTDSVMREFGM